MEKIEHCNVCASGRVVHLGIIKPYLDFQTSIYECQDCNCRFAPRDESVYELLHNSSTSSYAGHKKYAERLQRIFNDGNLDALKSLLFQTDKNRFIVDTIEALGNSLNILELGCSCGQLTSYSIKAGHNVLGIDVSQSAIDSARRLFGDHFATIDEPRVQSQSPYDLIYHVGTIGCVEDPIGFTQHYLKLLKPGGTLAFNCPNVAYCHNMDSIWVPSCLPPDLVTLFSKKLWEEQFADQAEVSIYEITEKRPKVDLSSLRLKFAPKGYLFEESHKNAGAVVGRAFNKIVSMLTKSAKIFGSRDVVSSEFGLHVVLRKK